jgi:hypothetical protein
MHYLLLWGSFKNPKKLIIVHTWRKEVDAFAWECVVGWGEACSELEWDFFWSDVGWMYEFFDHIHLADHQRFNHFRNYYELTRKDLLIKNLKRMKKTLEREGQLAEAAK